MYKISNIQEQQVGEDKIKGKKISQTVAKIEQYEIGMEVRQGKDKEGTPLSHFSPQARAQWNFGSHMKSFGLDDTQRTNFLNLVGGNKQLVELNMKLLANAALFLVKNNLNKYDSNSFIKEGPSFFIDGDLKNPIEGTVGWTLKQLDPNIVNDKDKYLSHKISLLRYLVWLTSLNNLE